MEKIKSAYAIPCMHPSDVESYDLDDIFFVTFDTRDEDEALTLASCVCGPRMAAKSLVIVNELGQVIMY